MDARPQMFQVYRDDAQAPMSVAALPTVQPGAQPRWAQDSNTIKKRKNNNLSRVAIATGVFVAAYLFFCGWVAFANHRADSLAQGNGEHASFPHPKLPWPFPRRPHHPHRRPHHIPPPIVLGCSEISLPSEAGATTTTELSVTIPRFAGVVLAENLLHGNVSVAKVNQSESEVSIHHHHGNKTILVEVTVANITWPPHPPKHELASSILVEEPENKEDAKFVLCALLPPPHHPPHGPHPHPPAPEMSETGVDSASEHPHPPPHHGPPHLPPTLIAVLPAHNSTYPKFPGPHHPRSPPASTEGMSESISIFSRTLKSTISFLFPMLSISNSRHAHFHPHGPHHHKPCPHHRPPFVVTSVKATVPLFTRVFYGHPPPPPPPFHRGPHHGWH